MELLTLCFSFDPRDDFRSFIIDDVCSLANKFYSKDFSKQEKLHLKYQLEHFELDIQHDLEMQKLSTISKLCQYSMKSRKSTIYPLIDRLVKLVLTLLVSTATTERAFSTMSLVKTKLHNKMGDDFLANSLITCIEKVIVDTFSIDSIINEFYTMKEKLKVSFTKTNASSTVSPAFTHSNDEAGRAKLAQVAKRLEITSRYFKRLGSLGFWGQLICTVVAAVILSFSIVITGKISSPASFYATAGGIAAAFISVFWSFGYIRLSEKLRKTAYDPSKAPPRADVVKGLKNGIVVNLLGMGAAILGMQATVGLLVAKALTSSANPYYQGISPGYNPVLALDVFLVQTNSIKAAISPIKKEETVETVKTQLENCYLLAAIKYTGLTVKQFQELRRSLPKSTKLLVANNTLVYKAIEGTQGEPLKPCMKGKTLGFLCMVRRYLRLLSRTGISRRRRSWRIMTLLGRFLRRSFMGLEILSSWRKYHPELRYILRFWEPCSDLQWPVKDVIVLLEAYLKKLEDESGGQ
ncbi:hypothetical protein GH714_033097 [Hevea brasiliensis]|uniref:HAT C-terminal dimerisation domain-containing protein n=1 Tax=Hevea brasiliensis TaxID=3981 RepID=A0A6A6N4H6_HEVBR|nr:hypothetical protein GH714_033097 [Hevea brasiliensis]